MGAKIPVTVVTGFLGSGKTTLLRHLLQNNQGRRIAVVVNRHLQKLDFSSSSTRVSDSFSEMSNEFGEVGIDGELLRSCQVCDDQEDAASNIVELTNGCLCCTVQEEFLPTMQELLLRREQIDCLLIETSGLALPKPWFKRSVGRRFARVLQWMVLLLLWTVKP
jgi:cobalamin biosynthesis protein CobW